MAFEFGHIHTSPGAHVQPSGHWLDIPVSETLILNNLIICYMFKFTNKCTSVT